VNERRSARNAKRRRLDLKRRRCPAPTLLRAAPTAARFCRLALIPKDAVRNAASSSTVANNARTLIPPPVSSVRSQSRHESHARTRATIVLTIRRARRSNARPPPVHPGRRTLARFLRASSESSAWLQAVVCRPKGRRSIVQPITRLDPAESPRCFLFAALTSWKSIHC